MTDTIRSVFNRLSVNGLTLLLETAKVPCPDFEGLGTRGRVSQALEAVKVAPQSARVECEAITGHIWLLAKKQDFAERALSRVCRGKTELTAILDEDFSLEERIFHLWLKDPKIIHRARNLAMADRSQRSRSHCRFKIDCGNGFTEGYQKALPHIQTLIQKLQRGRRVVADHFIYDDAEEHPDGGSTAGVSQPVHTIAIYLESPASMLLEFAHHEDTVISTLHREARELSIQYRPGAGVVDIAGRGLGGPRVFCDIAQILHDESFAGSEMIEIKFEHWRLQPFLSEQAPTILPPPGFTSVDVIEIAFAELGGDMVTVEGKRRDVYQRFKTLGLTEKHFSFQTVRFVSLRLQRSPEGSESKARDVTVTLRIPSTCQFENVTDRERTAIKAWLDASFLEKERSDALVDEAA